MDSLIEQLLHSLVNGSNNFTLSQSILEILEEDETKKVLEEIFNDASLNVNSLLPSPVTNSQEEEIKTELEAIILTSGRPVLLIKNDTFEKAVDPKWTEPLEAARKHIEFAVKAVGKIELPNHYSPAYAGTAWLVAPEIVVTNRHVAEVFAERKDNKFVFKPKTDLRRNMRVELNFKAEHPESETDDDALFKVNSILHIEERGGPDIAFLRISKTAECESLLNAAPIPLSKNSIEPDRNVAIIGYPAYDSNSRDGLVMARLFNNIYNVKRLQPGKITRVTDREIEHDCSTLGGNSGSVVLDLETGEAVALHFAGQSRHANYAVPASIIRDRLEKLKLS